MFIEKILLGITLSAPIGPVSLEMIKRGLDKGFLGAFVVRLGAAIGNTLCLIAAYFGIGLIAKSSNTMALFCLAGSLVLIYLGVKSLIDKRTFHLQSQHPTNASILNGLLTGFVLSIANPIGIVFWLSIFAATVEHSHDTPQSWQGLFQNFAVIGGVLLWGIFLSSLLELGKRFFNQKLIKSITTVAGIMLIYFGLKYAYKASLVMWENYTLNY